MVIPSPATSSNKIVQLEDTGIASYIEFPPDTFFLESLAQNAKYRSGVAFVPVQRLVNNVEETHLYEISPGMKDAKHIAGPLLTPDGSTSDITVFGSALSSQGVLFLCAFNRNSILAIDLKKLRGATAEKVVCDYEFCDLASPNDVCLDPKNENLLYVAGGTFRSPCCGCWCLCGISDGCTFANAVYGKVYKVDISNPKLYKTTVQASDLKTLAGIEVIDNNLWIAQLFNIVTQDQSTASSSSKAKVETVWRGNDKDDQVWLADNIDIWERGNEGTAVLCPAYSTLSANLVDNVLKRSFLSSAALFYSQIATAFVRGEGFQEALRDPEVSLSFSNTYIKDGEVPAPVRLVVFPKSSDTSEVFHFEIDLKETRSKHPPRDIKDRNGKTILGRRHFFNEQVTHAAHLKAAGSSQGYIACVNFEQPRILLLEDTAFRRAMVIDAVTE